MARMPMAKRTKFNNYTLKFPFDNPGFECMRWAEEIDVKKEGRKYHDYDFKDLAYDMNIFFHYLPRTECDRMVLAMLWCIRTALATRGLVELQDTAYLRVDDSYDNLRSARFKRPMRKRTVRCTPNTSLATLVTPMTLEYMTGKEVDLDIKKVQASSAPYFLKWHFRQGLALLQKVYTEKFEYIGYSPEYLSMLESTTDEELTKYVSSRSTRSPFPSGYKYFPPYVKRGFSDDEYLMVPHYYVNRKYLTHEYMQLREGMVLADYWWVKDNCRLEGKDYEEVRKSGEKYVPERCKKAHEENKEKLSAMVASWV